MEESSSLDQQSAANQGAEFPGYFAVSTTKFIVMSVCTLGLYEVFWFYKNWQRVKEKTGAQMMPFWRAVFAPLWAYVLFDHLRDQLKEWYIASTLVAGAWALLYLAFQVLSQFEAPVGLLAILSFSALLPANAAMSRINAVQQPPVELNDKIQGWNWLAVALGGVFYLMLALALLGPGDMAPAQRI